MILDGYGFDGSNSTSQKLTSILSDFLLSKVKIIYLDHAQIYAYEDRYSLFKDQAQNSSTYLQCLSFGIGNSVPLQQPQGVPINLPSILEFDAQIDCSSFIQHECFNFSRVEYVTYGRELIQTMPLVLVSCESIKELHLNFQTDLDTLLQILSWLPAGKILKSLQTNIIETGDNRLKFSDLLAKDITSFSEKTTVKTTAQPDLFKLSMNSSSTNAFTFSLVGSEGYTCESFKIQQDGSLRVKVSEKSNNHTIELIKNL